jgi:hypothetical protein
VSQTFSKPVILEDFEYSILRLKESNTDHMVAGAPLLPEVIQRYEFPLGTKITDISYTLSNVRNLPLPKPLKACSTPYPYSTEDRAGETMNAIYTKDAFYPPNWFTYKLSGGLNKNNIRTTFLTLHFFPYRYNPVKKTIQYITSIEMDIVYETPQVTLPLNDQYDMIIISYDRYASLLEPLVEHKCSVGIETLLVPLNDIYSGTYFSVQGRDKPEQMKYFIKNAMEEWNITYVLLVGNFNKVPVRYVALETDAGGPYEELEFVSDLYYADIYDATGNFSSWDTNENGVYGEWPYPQSHPMEDTVDLTPDVYVGRLACMFGFEVRTMVNKIIDYETNAYNAPWFNTFIVGGGDTFDKSWEGGTDYNEGEEANEKAVEYMTGFTPVRIWSSLGNLQTQTIHDEICKGAGFLYLVGHGNPMNWATHHNGDYTNWTEGFTNRDIYKLYHKGKYPILMVGGCHNSEIDVTPLNFIKGLLEEGLHYFSGEPGNFGSYWMKDWVPECWSWVFVKKNRGGAIASMGSTGYGCVSIGDDNDNGIPDCVEGVDGWFETQFFRLYNEEEIDILGVTYGQVVSDYVITFPVYSYRYDCKVVETHILLGDPSMKIGGYR